MDAVTVLSRERERDLVAQTRRRRKVRTGEAAAERDQKACEWAKLCERYPEYERPKRGHGVKEPRVATGGRV